MQKNYTQDTICAIATAPGGAIGIIRLSGTESIKIVDKIFVPVGKDKRSLQKREPYTVTYGHVLCSDTEILDEVLVSIFRAPHSYTGEESVEISCHGSLYILREVMRILLENGCRAAGPGEFTQRAFLNGKMDLSQAEAVADVIASSNQANHRLAMSQMRGGFSKELSVLRDKLLHLTSLIELELDFSDHEDLEFSDRTELKLVAEQIEGVISELVESFRVGNALKNGIPVAIVGETNAGKSTLLNALLNEERAIVSDVRGTTRDVIEDTMTIDGIMFRFIDTAGIREAHDEIERIGIDRSFQKLNQAEIVLWVIDSVMAKTEYETLSPKILPACKNKQVIVVLNKSELVSSPTVLKSLPDTVLTVSLSAKQKYGIAELKSILVQLTGISFAPHGNLIVTNIRHYEALSKALSSIKQVQKGLDSSLSSDFISQDLRECLFYLSEIVGGEVTSDEVLGNIFKHFCIGK